MDKGDSEGPRKHREMGLFDLLKLMGRVMGHRAVVAAAGLIRSEAPPATP